MGSPKTPVDSFVMLPSTGDTMTPSKWHAMIDGLQADDFGVSDFFNGDARVITHISDPSQPPPFAQGQVWSSASEITQIHESTMVTEAPQLLGDHFAILCWCNTSVSLGTPVYFEGRFARVKADGGWFAVPNVRRSVTSRSVKWAPGMGFSLDSSPGSSYIRVGIAGFMWALTNDSAVTFGDGCYFNPSDDTVTHAQNGGDFYTKPTQRCAVGLFTEKSTAAGTLRALRMYKQAVPWDEVR